MDVRTSIFIRQGKLIERNVSMFPLYQEPKEEFLTFLGQFYSKHYHLKPREVVLPREIDGEMAAKLLDVNVTQPKSGKRKNSST